MIRAAAPVLAAAAGLAALCLASLLFGARTGVGPADLAALFDAPAPDDVSGLVVRSLRLPRTLAALIAGGALGAAGALIQTLTRNPMADPGLLGVNAGAALAIVLTLFILGPVPAAALVIPSMAGAAAAVAAVWAIGATSRNPITLILAGSAITLVLAGLLRAIILIDRFALDAYRRWTIGAVDGADMAVIAPAAAMAGAGLLLAAMAARRLDAALLGDDMARALGANLALTRGVTLVAVAVLSAAAVLVAGPLAFVGLVAPHLARGLGAQNAGTLIAGAALVGAALVIAADVAGRLILPGVAIEAGIGVSLIGGPFLIWLVRRAASRPA